MKYLLLLITIFNLYAQDKTCSCHEIGMEDRLNEAILVTDGEIILKTYKSPSRIFQVKVAQKYKGSFEFDEFFIYSNTDECGVDFELKQKYVFYINKFVDDKKVFLNKCHFFYALNEKTINSKKHIFLISNMNSDKKERSFKTPNLKNSFGEDKKGRFSEKIEKKHTEESN